MDDQNNQQNPMPAQDMPAAPAAPMDNPMPTPPPPVMPEPVVPAEPTAPVIPSMPEPAMPQPQADQGAAPATGMDADGKVMAELHKIEDELQKMEQKQSE